MDSIKSLIHRKPIVLHPEATSGQAARIMCERGTGTVLIADREGHILGILTDRDLACRALQAVDGDKTPVSSLMSEKLISLDESATVSDVVKAMERNGVRRIPIIQRISSGRMRCLGIITLDDLIAAESIDIKQASPVVRRQMIRRAARSETHRYQTLRLFFRQMSEKLELSEEASERIVRFVLSALVQRLSFTGAAHLLSQLPSRLQEDLLTLPPGPDRHITVGTLLTGVMDEFKIEESQARATLIKAFAALTEFLDPGEIEHVKGQLPEEFRALFVGTEQARSKLAISKSS